MKKEVKGVSHPVELFSKSFAAVRNNLAIFTLLYVLPLTFVLGGGRRSEGGHGGPNDNFHWGMRGDYGNDLSARGAAVIAIFVLLAVVIGLLISIFYQALLYSAQLLAAKGHVSFRDVWAGAVKNWGRLFLLVITMSVIIGVGLLLFIIPGLIFIRRYFLAPYYMIDQDLGVFEALRRSARASKPASTHIWGVIGMTLLLSLPSFFSDIGSVISLVLLAGYSVAPAILYLETKKAVKV